MDSRIPSAIVVECSITNHWADHLRGVFSQHAQGKIKANEVAHEWRTAYIANCERLELGIAK